MNQEKAERGDRVTVYVTGKDEEDAIFTKSSHKKPIEFKIGEGRLLPCIEDSVIGMQVGEKHHFRVQPEEGFGDYQQNLVTVVKKHNFPENISPKEGKTLKVKTDTGNVLDTRITSVEGDDVTLDANHPLAGQTLHFEVKMLAIQKQPSN
jgi:FKBP-type peptidyl-prolyl cis-trans isomerase 2